MSHVTTLLEANRFSLGLFFLKAAASIDTLVGMGGNGCRGNVAREWQYEIVNGIVVGRNDVGAVYRGAPEVGVRSHVFRVDQSCKQAKRDVWDPGSNIWQSKNLFVYVMATSSAKQ